MICVRCIVGKPEPGTTTVTFEHAGTTVVINGAPAEICPQCGARYYDDVTTERLLTMAKEAARPGTKLQLREYAAA